VSYSLASSHTEHGRSCSNKCSGSAWRWRVGSPSWPNHPWPTLISVQQQLLLCFYSQKSFTWKCNLLFAAFFAFVLVDLLLWNDICSSGLATWLHLFAKYTLPICQLHIDFISSQSPFCQVTKFVSWTNSLSPCCQVHFTKSWSSYQELVESMLSSPFCQVTKFISWTCCWVHVVKSILPSHQIRFMNSLSPHCRVHFAKSPSLYH